MAGEYPYYDARQGVGQLIAALITRGVRNRQNAMPLGAALGYQGQSPSAPTPGPIQSIAAGARTVPIAPPMTAPSGMMTAPTPPQVFPTAPMAMQPLLSRPVKDLTSLKTALGEPTVRDLYGTMGITRTPGSSLIWDDTTGTFKVNPNAKTVRSQDAGIILKQSELKNKKNLQNWRDAVEARLAKGQLAREEALALRADSDLLGYMLNPEFDMLDDTMKQALTAQATAAINRLQQRGVKVYTGARARAAGSENTQAPASTQRKPTETPSPAPQESVNQRRMRRYKEIKAQYPSLTNDQIAAQIAVEEGGE